MKSLSFLASTVGSRYEAFIPSEAVLLSQGVDIRDYGVRLTSSIRAANLLILTDAENTTSFDPFIEIIHGQMSLPARILYFSTQARQRTGALHPDASLNLGQLTVAAVVDALRQRDLQAAPDSHAGHGITSMKHHPQSEHDMDAMNHGMHAGHIMPATISKERAGHNMTSMDHSPRGGNNSMPGMDHSTHAGHDAGSFMSMVAMTEGQFRSRDGLIMEPGEVIFGPFHPALAPGWQLKLLLDGDTVQTADINILEPGTVSREHTFDAGTYRTLAGLLRFGEVLGWQRFTGSIRRALLLLNSPEKAQLQHQLIIIAGQVHHNPLVRYRLIGLGNYRDQDAWARLVAAVDGLVAGSPASLGTPVAALSEMLVSLEVGDAVIVIASFCLEGAN